QTDNSCLGGGVGHLTGGPPLSPDGGDIHNGPRLAVDHGRQHCLDGVVRAIHIDGKDPMPECAVDVLELVLLSDPGIVHQTGDGAESRFYLPYGGSDGVPVGYVRLDRQSSSSRGADLRRQSLSGLPGLEIVDPYSEALRCQTAYYRPANPPAAAGN